MQRDRGPNDELPQGVDVVRARQKISGVVGLRRVFYAAIAAAAKKIVEEPSGQPTQLLRRVMTTSDKAAIATHINTVSIFFTIDPLLAGSHTNNGISHCNWRVNWRARKDSNLRPPGS